MKGESQAERRRRRKRAADWLRKRQQEREAEASVALDPTNHTGVHTCDGRCADKRGSTKEEG